MRLGVVVRGREPEPLVVFDRPRYVCDGEDRFHTNDLYGPGALVDRYGRDSSRAFGSDRACHRLQPVPLIEDYALIGDLQTAALVSREGSIDWCCFPRFDSGACFAALLGDEGNGRWRLGPAGEVRDITRRYRGDTLVLETEFRTGDGTVRLLDCMPIRGKAPDVIRIVEGVDGRVPMSMELIIRFDYGRVVPWVFRREDSLSAIAGPDALCLRTPVETRGEGLTTVAEFEVVAGDRVPFVLTWHPSHEPPPEPLDALGDLDETAAWWEDWSSGADPSGLPEPDAVARSLITLKALTYAPTGGIVAAPTTS